jgi:hypothetical protein
MDTVHQPPPTRQQAAIVGVETRAMARGTLETFTVRVPARMPRQDAERAARALVDRTPAVAVRRAPAVRPSAPLRPVRRAARAPRRVVRVVARVTRSESPPSPSSDPPSPAICPNRDSTTPIARAAVLSGGAS